MNKYQGMAAALAMVLAWGGVAPARALEEGSDAAAQDARATVLALADLLARDYVFPETGEKYAGMLRARVAAGAYAGLDGEPLGDQLTADLQALSPDRHLRIRPAGAGPVVVRAAAPAGAPPEGAPPPRPRAVPPMEAAQWLAPGIAFVRFNLFPGSPEVTAASARFMAEHADAKAIIFDIRTHRGGGLNEMDAIFPWLFAKPTRLVTMATRRSVDEGGDSPLSGDRSLREVAGTKEEVVREHWATPNADKRLRDAKIYLLTSPFTGSAAEHFSLAMKHTGRGTLVGRATGGANHFGGIEELPGGLTVFIPVGRTFDPVTGKDWEGVGVAPDVDIAPEAALVHVLTELGIAAEEAKRLSDSVAPVMPMRRIGPGSAPVPSPNH